jgi:hypothetical protein
MFVALLNGDTLIKVPTRLNHVFLARNPRKSQPMNRRTIRYLNAHILKLDDVREEPPQYDYSLLSQTFGGSCYGSAVLK